jgi:hypothetical protein
MHDFLGCTLGSVNRQLQKFAPKLARDEHLCNVLVKSHWTNAFENAHLVGAY